MLNCKVKVYACHGDADGGVEHGDNAEQWVEHPAVHYVGDCSGGAIEFGAAQCLGRFFQCRVWVVYECFMMQKSEFFE